MLVVAVASVIVSTETLWNVVVLNIQGLGFMVIIHHALLWDIPSDMGYKLSQIGHDVEDLEGL